MGLLDCASSASVRRGYDYFKEKKVLSIKETEANIFEATVSGSHDTPYLVEIHIDHPRKSKCNCPHTDGKRITCKHMIAAYFAALPQEAEKYYKEVVAYQEEEEKREEELSDKVCEYVWNMEKSEAQEALLQLLFYGPEWQYSQFVEAHGLDSD